MSYIYDINDLNELEFQQIYEALIFGDFSHEISELVFDGLDKNTHFFDDVFDLKGNLSNISHIENHSPIYLFNELLSKSSDLIHEISKWTNEQKKGIFYLYDKRSSIDTFLKKIEGSAYILSCGSVRLDALAIIFLDHPDQVSPSFSIMMPTYNHAQFIEQSIRSIQEQTYEDWELVIVNDGSTDSTKEIVENIKDEDHRIKVIHKENGGTASALNVALKNCENDWIGWLSSDDIFKKNKLALHSLFVRLFGNKIQFYFTNFSHLDSNSLIHIPYEVGPLAHLKHQDLKALILSGNFIVGITPIIHRNLFNQVGHFNEGLKYVQDYDMWCRLIELSEPKYIPITTASVRLGDHQNTVTGKSAASREAKKIFVHYLSEFDSDLPKDMAFSCAKILLLAYINQRSTLNVLNEPDHYLETVKELIYSAAKGRKSLHEFKQYFFQNIPYFPLPRHMQRILPDMFKQLEKMIEENR